MLNDYSRIWKFFTVKAFCGQCDISFLIEDGKFSLLLQHLDLHDNEGFKSDLEIKPLDSFEIGIKVEEETLSSPIPCENPVVIPFITKQGLLSDEEEEYDQCDPLPDQPESDPSFGLEEKSKEIKIKSSKRNKKRSRLKSVEENDDLCTEGFVDEKINWGTVWNEISYRWNTIWDYWISDKDSKVWKCKFCERQMSKRIRSVAVVHTKGYHLDQISLEDKNEILLAKRKRINVHRRLRKEYNLAEKGPVVDPESGKTMHIHKFMQKVGKQKTQNNQIRILQNFVKDMYNPGTFSCKLCQETVTVEVIKGVKKLEKLYDHMQRDHDLYTDQKKCLCPDCGAVYFSKDALNTHQMNVHIKQYKFFCPFDQCKKGFFRKDYVYDEHVRSHTGEKPLLCSICGEGFNYSKRLTAHVAFVHKGESKFVCKFCQRPFLTSTQKNKHERTHTGERPFKCEVCDKRFGQKHHLTTHMRVHTGDAPYECTKCNQKFKYLPQRNSHKCAF